MEGSSVVSRRIDRKSSIETEPRTLRNHQIQNAREAAVYVLNTRSIEEAMNVFLEGLEPVESGRKQDGEIMMEIREELEYLENEVQSPLPRHVASANF